MDSVDLCEDFSSLASCFTMGGSPRLDVSFSARRPSSPFLPLFFIPLLHEPRLELCGAAVVCLILDIRIRSGNTLPMLGGVRSSQ